VDTAVEHSHAHPRTLAYLQLQESLVRSDAAAAEEAAGRLAAAAADDADWSEALAGFPEELAAQRERFAAITGLMLPYLDGHPEAAEGTAIGFCPMAFQGTGASWVQVPGMLRNPYYGDLMLTCGRFQSPEEAKASLDAGNKPPPSAADSVPASEASSP